MKSLFVIMVTGIFIFIMQAVFYPSESAEIYKLGIIKITSESLYQAIKFSTRIIIISTSIIILTIVTPFGAILTIMESIGFPRKGSYIFLESLRMLHEFRQRIQIIFEARKSKGLNDHENLISRFRAFYSGLVTITIILFSTLPEREPTALVRGFDWHTTKSSIIDFKDTTVQLIIRIILLSLIASLIVYRLIL